MDHSPPVLDLNASGREGTINFLMKSIKLIVTASLGVVIVVAALAAGPVAPPSRFRNLVTFTWDNDTNSVVDAFKLYTSTDITVPITNWTLVATVSGDVRSIAISNIAAQQAWFYATASNWWGESPPSNIAGIPQPPSVVNLRIGP